MKCYACTVENAFSLQLLISATKEYINKCLTEMGFIFLSREMEKARTMQVFWVRRLLFSNRITVNQSWKLVHLIITIMIFCLNEETIWLSDMEFQHIWIQLDRVRAAFPLCVIRGQEHIISWSCTNQWSLSLLRSPCTRCSWAVGQAREQEREHSAFYECRKANAAQGVREERSKGACLALNAWSWQDRTHAARWASSSSISSPYALDWLLFSFYWLIFLYIHLQQQRRTFLFHVSSYILSFTSFW